MAKPDLSKFTAKRVSGQGNSELAALLSLGEVLQVDLTLVDRDSGQPRPYEEVQEGIEKFADEIERDEFVLAQLPIYNIENNGRFTIVIGERRTEAFKLKKQKTIPAICKRFTLKERERIFILQYVENDETLKKPLSPLADARWWRTYTDRFHEGKVAEAAKARGRSLSDITNRLALLDAPEQIKAFAEKSQIKDPASLAALARLARRSGDDMVNQVISDFEAGEVKGSFRTYVETIARESKQARQLNTETITVSDKGPKAKKDTKNSNIKSKEESPARKELRKIKELIQRAEFTADLIASNTDNNIELYDDLLSDISEAMELLKSTKATFTTDRTRTKAGKPK